MWIQCCCGSGAVGPEHHNTQFGVMRFLSKRAGARAHTHTHTHMHAHTHTHTHTHMHAHSEALRCQANPFA
jgi:hypothetical protein